MAIKTTFVNPPITTRVFDWQAIDDNTYCCPECNSPVGRGKTEQDAIDDLLEQIRERGFLKNADTR